ncbi:hypothetical protein HS99_0004920 [Kitasatospora aureofaciens]|uniref:Uncharacterized protein n=1 Tax=Kitasatospora aureofaciens TaxID=1894 RepID=A0A1E7N9L0_KITAU|nr:hypothetical protein B6264_24070 [Kitasatospora aureofaciens]OEV37163.1 hypothetical protein HS99_0004920 [Kitasatospora aureofaciens]
MRAERPGSAAGYGHLTTGALGLAAAHERTLDRARVDDEPDLVTQSGSQLPCGDGWFGRTPGVDAAHDLIGQLGRALRAGLAGDHGARPAGVQGGGDLVDRLAAVAEGTGALGDGHLFAAYPPHHLVLDLHHVPRVAERRGEEHLVDRLLPGDPTERASQPGGRVTRSPPADGCRTRRPS